MIDDSQGHGDGGGMMRFRLWPAQVDVVWQVMVTPLVIILKARQLGISWICCGYALWTCLFAPGKVVLLFSQGQLEADEMLRRVRELYDRLPAWMREAQPYAREPNTSTLRWANGSAVRSLPATQKAGRSFTASLVVMDEAAHMQWAGPLYTALKPTIDGGGQLIILSTAKGIGNFFHLHWTKAAARLNTFLTIFLPWWARPGRDREWYDRQLANESEPGLTLQEYPSTAIDAFRVTGRVRFAQAWISAQSKNALPPLEREALPVPLRTLDGLTVYRLPDARKRYILAADVAEGLEHGDYSGGVVIDPETWEEMADLHGRWEPDEFAKHLATLGHAFGTAEIIPERNNHGHAVLLALKTAAYPRIALGRDERPGWRTDVQTKPQSIDLLAEALRDGLVKVRTEATLDELLIYRVEPGGGTSAPPSFYDDRVMKWAVALAYIRLRNPTPTLAGAGTAVDVTPRDHHGRRAGETRRDPFDSGDDDDNDDGQPGRRRRSFYGR